MRGDEMIRIGLVEDQEVYRQQLRGSLIKFQTEEGVSFQIEEFSDGHDFIERYDSEFDILLMDIQMPLVDGMSAIEEIRKRDAKVLVIFITCAAQYAIKGYHVNAMGYILKPFNYYSLSEYLKKAIKRLPSKEEFYLTIKTRQSYYRVSQAEIQYIESQGHKLIFSLQKKELESKGVMRELEKQLKPEWFVRIHRGYIVNLNHIKEVNNATVVVGEIEIPISRGRRKLIMDTLVKQWHSSLKH